MRKPAQPVAQLISTFVFAAVILCGCTAQFELELHWNPEDSFFLGHATCLVLYKHLIICEKHQALTKVSLLLFFSSMKSQLIGAFVFATWIVQSRYILNTEISSL